MEKRYTRDHEWIAVSGDIATIGISTFAQEQLGDVVFVELPEPGRALGKGDSFAVVESVKAASDVYAPVAGEVVEINAALPATPELINEDAEEGGWMVKLRLADPGALSDLMDRAAYDAFLATIN